MNIIPKTMKIGTHEIKNIHSMFMLVYFIERRSKKYSSSVEITSMPVFSCGIIVVRQRRLGGKFFLNLYVPMF